MGVSTHSVCMISLIASLLLVSLLFIAITTPFLIFCSFLVTLKRPLTLPCVVYDCLINDVMCVIIRIVVIVNTTCCDSCTIVIIVILNTYICNTTIGDEDGGKGTAIARVYGHF